MIVLARSVFASSTWRSFTRTCSRAALMRATSALFSAVYVTATAAGNKLLTGAARTAARVAFAVVLVVFAFSGAYILVPLAIVAVTKVSISRRAVPV